MEFISSLGDIGKDDVKMAGGKGASLGELYGIAPVPEGFVVPTHAFDHFLDANGFKDIIDGEMRGLCGKQKQTVEIDAEKIEQVSFAISMLILGGKVPNQIETEAVSCFREQKMRYVAVRSSASMEDGEADSWAGELESYLNTDQGHLLINIKKCWASLFSPRAIRYSMEKRFSFGDYSVAVVVQKMVPSEVSGIAFTAHPVTRNEKQMLIEACWGLGELVVGGQVTPDNYLIDRKGKLILEANIYPQEKMLVRDKTKNAMVKVPKNKVHRQKLSGRQITELVKLSRKIEKHFGNPQDIEWARADGKFYIVQSRPITTLGKGSR